MTTGKKPYARVQYDWTPEIIALLGTMSDGAVAAHIGGKAATVQFKRQELKIKPFKPKPGAREGKRRPNFNWTKEALGLLGTKPDSEIAKLLGLSSNTVSHKRRSQGIVGRKPKRDPIVMPEHLIHHLGKWTDAKIAKEIGVSANAVSKYRRRRQIKATIEHNALSPKAIPMLGTMQDAELARMFNVTNTTIHTHRLKLGRPLFISSGMALPDPVRPLLGTMPDGRLAKQIGVSPQVITRWRTELGVEVWNRLPRDAAALLGKVSDSKIAAMVGVSNSFVAKVRIAQGIDSYGLPRSLPFPDDKEHLLGTMTDSKLANQLGISHATVFKRRNRNGIAAAGTNIERRSSTEEMTCGRTLLAEPQAKASPKDQECG